MDVPAALGLCHLDGLDFSPMRSTYFLNRETVISTKRIGMARGLVRLSIEERQQQPALLQPAVEPGDRAGNPGGNLSAAFTIRWASGFCRSQQAGDAFCCRACSSKLAPTDIHY